MPPRASCDLVVGKTLISSKEKCVRVERASHTFTTEFSRQGARVLRFAFDVDGLPQMRFISQIVCASLFTCLQVDIARPLSANFAST